MGDGKFSPTKFIVGSVLAFVGAVVFSGVSFCIIVNYGAEGARLVLILSGIGIFILSRMDKVKIFFKSPRKENDNAKTKR